MRRFRGFAIGLMAGCMLMVAVPGFAATIKEYILVKAGYPIVVNEGTYENTDLPILNYEGNTYIPMRAVGDLLGASVTWNNALKRAEIRYESVEATSNSAYRNIVVAGSNGHYTVSGEARVFEATMSYSVSDGHTYLLEEFHTLSEGAPEWSDFTLDIDIPSAQLPENGTLMLELFEYSAKDGSKINMLNFPLESFM